MKAIVDTQSVLWAVDDPSRLGTQASIVLLDPSNELIISAATLWEVAIKVGLGKLTLSLPYRDWMTRAISDLGAAVLPITVEYAAFQASLPLHHRNPFDRLVIAQAMVERFTVISSDRIFDQYQVPRIW